MNISERDMGTRITLGSLALQMEQAHNDGKCESKNPTSAAQGMLLNTQSNPMRSLK